MLHVTQKINGDECKAFSRNATYLFELQVDSLGNYDFSFT